MASHHCPQICSFCSPSSKIVSFTRCYLTACSVLLRVFPAVCYIFSGSQGSVQQDDIGPVLRRAKTFALYVFVVWHVLPFLFICLCHFITDSNMASMLPKRAMQKASLMVKGVLGREFQGLGQMVFVCSELCQLQVYINRQLNQLVYVWMIQSEDAWCLAYVALLLYTYMHATVCLIRVESICMHVYPAA